MLTSTKRKKNESNLTCTGINDADKIARFATDLSKNADKAKVESTIVLCLLCTTE